MRAGDFLHVPAWLVYREINRSKEFPFRRVVIRSTSEPIVVNLPEDAWKQVCKRQAFFRCSRPYCALLPHSCKAQFPRGMLGTCHCNNKSKHRPILFHHLCSDSN
jgi:hypothetical protein